MWFSHLTQLRSLELNQVVPGDGRSELELELLPPRLRRLSVTSSLEGRALIKVNSFPCFAENLELRLEAGWIDLSAGVVRPGAGAGIQLHLACNMLYMGSTDASEMLNEAVHAAARCLLDWVQSFAADGVSISSRSGSEELMIHVQDAALTVVYSSYDELISAVQAASTLLSPQIPPAVTCSVVSSQDRPSFLRFMVTR